MALMQNRSSNQEASPIDTTGLFVNAYGQTVQGTARNINEDQYLIAAFNRQLDIIQTSLVEDECAGLDAHSHGWVFLVADGMGGHAAGEEASALAVETSMRYMRETMPWFVRLGPEEIEAAEIALQSIVHTCHRAVREAASAQPNQSEMGTTLTLAYVLWPHLFVVHAGDTRCYLLRGGDLRQITRDHTMAQDLADQTNLESEELGSPRLENILTEAVGGGKKDPPEPAVYQMLLEDRDTLLLCSDGLTKAVPDDEIRRLLSGEGFANLHCQTLVQAADAAGGTDDVTVVVASFEDFTAGQQTP